MKILVVGPYYFDNVAWSCSNTLKKMGHDVTVFDPTAVLGFTSLTVFNKLFSYGKRMIFREPDWGMNRKLIRAVGKTNLDLVLILGGGYSGNIYPGCISEIKATTKSKIVCWFTDAISNMGRQYMIGSDYDALFFKEPLIVEKLKNNLGRKNVFFLQHCCDPAIHKPVRLTKSEEDYYRCDIAIIGNMYYYRTELLKKLMNYKIKIWGAKPPSWLNMGDLKKFHMGRPVWGEEKAKVFRAAKIVLNNNHYAEILGVNLRTLEAAACGGFQIVDNIPGIEKLFIKDKEIIVYNDLRDLIDKIDYYIAHPKEREKISARASKKALSKYTYEKQLTKLLKFTGF